MVFWKLRFAIFSQIGHVLVSTKEWIFIALPQWPLISPEMRELGRIKKLNVIPNESSCSLSCKHRTGNRRGRIRIEYSLVCFALFRLVKRIVEYFAKEWSGQKVPITDVAGLNSTYQKYIMIGAPSNSYQFREKWTWVFLPKNLQKSKHFSMKSRGFFEGSTPGPFWPPTTHQKIFEGY